MTRAMSLTNVSLRDEKKVIRKAIKQRLAKLSMEEVVDQCAKALGPTFSGWQC
jgi:hypothetical protein